MYNIDLRIALRYDNNKSFPFIRQSIRIFSPFEDIDKYYEYKRYNKLLINRSFSIPILKIV